MTIFDLIDNIGKIKIIDAGAMLVGEACVYQKLIDRDMAEVIGFEPDESECNKLNQTYAASGSKIQYFPYAIGDGSRKQFYVTNTGMTSSLFKPDINLMSKFNNLSELCQVIDIEWINTKKLDDICEAKGADYFKIDIQGAEYEVFENAREVLQDVLVVHTEVEFVPLYKKQPLFADVDRLLRENGFCFHNFSGVSGRAFKPIIVNNDINRPMSQLLWADAVYVKDFMDLSRLAPEKLLKLAVILHELYHSMDFCHYILSIYDRKTENCIAEKYLKEVLGIK